jgi:hypothetical protein
LACIPLSRFGLHQFLPDYKSRVHQKRNLVAARIEADEAGRNSDADERILRAFVLYQGMASAVPRMSPKNAGR